MSQQVLHPHPFRGNEFGSREDAQRAARDLFEPLVPYYRAGGARPLWGETGVWYDEATIGMEAWIRPLWAIGPLAAGGGDFAHWDVVRQGLVNGTDPNHPQYWGAVGATPATDPTTDQRMVEMAAFGLLLAIAHRDFFDPLTDEQKANVLTWLRPINEIGLRENNWQFFRVLANIGFEEVGGPVDWEAAAESLATLEANYLGDGWYQDGVGQKTVDYYIPFAFHYYSMIYAGLRGHRDPELAATFRQRAKEFTPSWAARHDSEGRQTAYGRSMIYRFANAGFWGALAFGNCEALPWGQIRGYWAKNMRWWAKQQIFGKDGILTVGWNYPNLLMTETYNAPGSPYWACKAFLPLALPADHPFWTAEEEDTGTDELHLEVPKAYAVTNRKGSVSITLTHSGPAFAFPRQGNAKYMKFAYSSAFPFAIEPEDLFHIKTPSDNSLALIDPSALMNVRPYDRRVRQRNTEFGQDGDILWCRWEPFEDVKVLSVFGGEGYSHARVHVVDSPRPLQSVEGAFAIQYDFDPYPPNNQQVRTAQDHGAVVANATAFTAASDPTGRREAIVADMMPNASLQYPRTVTCALRGDIQPGRSILTGIFAACEKPDTLTTDLGDIPARIWEVANTLAGADLREEIEFQEVVGLLKAARAKAHGGQATQFEDAVKLLRGDSD